jgi:hypothetical protein
MTYLDEDALAGVRSITRERKLSTAERLAIFAFARRGVPIKVIARTFSVSPNAIRYITNYEHTAAHEVIKTEYERLGEERVWAEIVSDKQIASINDNMRLMFNGKELNDRGYRRIDRRSPRARRTGATPGLLKATSDGEDGGRGAD